MKKESFRRILIRVFWCSLIFTLGFSWIYIRYAVPDKLNLVVNEEEVFHFSLPPGITFESDSEEVILKNSSDIPDGMIRIDRPDSVSMCGKNEGSYLVGMKFLGLILMKEIQVDVVDSSCAIPCGTPVGIYLSSKGVMVIGTGQVTNKTGNVVEPAYGLLKSGDYIQTINGETLEDKDALVDAVNASGGKAMILGIRRDGREIDVNMTPVLADDGHYKLGAWVRDDTQGIGTMTYVDMNGCFGALGDVTENTTEGIYGTVNRHFLDSLQADAIPIGFRQDIQRGRAYIRSKVSGEVRDYEIEIQKVDYGSVQKNKGLVLKVVDEDLLNLTGGIVQDGKLIGAVTHVFINDPTRGYGIFMENMLGH